MSYREVLALPVMTFWMLHRNVDRIAAEQDMRSATIAVKSQSGEAIQSMMTDLSTQMGQVIEIDTEASVKAEIASDNNNRSDLADLAYIGDLTLHEHPG